MASKNSWTDIEKNTVVVIIESKMGYFYRILTQNSVNFGARDSIL